MLQSLLLSFLKIVLLEQVGLVLDSDISWKWQTLMQKQRTAAEERAKKFYSLFYLIKEAQKFYPLFYPDQGSFTHFTQKFFSPFHPDHGNFTPHN